MAFDSNTRNRLARFVAACRKLLCGDFKAPGGEMSRLLAQYGIQPDGAAMDIGDIPDLDENQRETARVLREILDHKRANAPKAKVWGKFDPAVYDLLQEQGFTILNRLCALRMAEERGIVLPCVAKGTQSDGFQLFEYHSGKANPAFTLETRYQHFLQSMFDELSLDLGALFYRFSTQGILFPGSGTLAELLAEINHADLAALWAEDETIGWIYQYWNSKEERKAMRDASAAPRNSRELAVRNQFFTPRYVVEFLTDNTLGRIWHEMTKGQTRLAEQCRYLVRRPTEIFLGEGEDAPDPPEGDTEQTLSQEELLKQPVHIPHRPVKDPREIRLLDPACGSMHFGLYAFDLFEAIYEEAWDKGHCPALQEAYPEKADYLRDVPRLIIEHNIHGVDIDPRAVQIAGLSLWLRAQKTWKDTPAAERPRVRRSNIVCAEPMPGSDAMLEDFVQTLDPPLLGELVKTVFDKLQLAGEAGTLLKIEEEIRTSIDDAKAKWEKLGAAERDLFSAEELNQTLRPGTQQELTGVEKALTTDQRPLATDFFDTAEERIYAALRDYAESGEAGDYQRRLFAEDAAHGFAFIDLCRKRYDAVVMNPPFGDASLPSKPYIDTTYGDTKGDVYKAFVECFHARIVPTGFLGIISSRTGFFLSWSEDWRTRVVMRSYRPLALADLGMGVLDAMVEVAAYVLRTLSEGEAKDLTLSLVPFLREVSRDRHDRFSLPKWQAARSGIKRHQAAEELLRLEASGFIQSCPGAHVRYAPIWERVNEAIAPKDPVYPPLVCVRALEADDKSTAVLAGVRNLDEGQQFVCDPKSFEGVPGTPFAYWVSRSFLSIGKRFSSFEPANGHVRVGVQTDNDPRFVRTWWEVPPLSVATPITETSASRNGWVPFLKGDESSTFHFDHPLVLNWHNSGTEVKAATEDAPGGRINNEVDYFKAGISWALRTAEFSPHVVPFGCIPSVSRYLALPASSQTMATIGLWNSCVMDAICKFRMERHGHPKFIIGVVKETPFPSLSPQAEKQLADLAQTIWHEKATSSSFEMASHLFWLPCIQARGGQTLAERGEARVDELMLSGDRIATTKEQIEELGFSLFGLSASDRAALNSSPLAESSSELAFAETEAEQPPAETKDLVSEAVDYALGTSLGRWDIRYATGERQPPELPAPFDPLPVCPPGMLQNADGLPAAPADVPDDYPLPITWPGILVDDDGHPEDIIARVRDALAVIWGDRASAIEQEACEILGVRTLRETFAEKRSGGKFFKDHLKRYSKSRRQAPIYWPLSTESGTYTLWIYYHRLTEDTLYACITNFVAPKQEQSEKTFEKLAAKEGRTNKEDKELEAARDLMVELGTFREELERIAKFWKPNLNDGVQITAAPLWNLFRLTKWRKKLKETWEKLEAGEYDWAHLAHSIWPERVVPKCAEDRSLAIAHGVEEDLWEEVETTSGRGRKIKRIWQPKADVASIAARLVNEVTSQ